MDADVSLAFWPEGMPMFARKLIMLAVTLLFLNGAAMVRAQATGGGNGPAAGQKAKTQSYSGTIANVGANGGSFTIADKNGAAMVVRTSAATTFQLDKNKTTFAGAVQVGLTVKGNLSADGSATTVNSSSPKIAAIDRIRLALNVGDDEWSVLRPKIERIQAIQTQLSDATVSAKNIVPPGATLAEIKAELVARRDMRAKLTEELTALQASLVRIITMRQELILVQVGILE